MMIGDTVVIDAQNDSSAPPNPALSPLPMDDLRELNWKRTANTFADQFARFYNHAKLGGADKPRHIKFLSQNLDKAGVGLYTSPCFHCTHEEMKATFEKQIRAYGMAYDNKLEEIYTKSQPHDLPAGKKLGSTK